MVVIEDLGGHCPVQATGTVDGEPFYFRARGCHWSIGIGGEPILDPKWQHDEEWGNGPFDAGWMGRHIAAELIARAAGMYRK